MGCHDRLDGRSQIGRHGIQHRRSGLQPLRARGEVALDDRHVVPAYRRQRVRADGVIGKLLEPLPDQRPVHDPPILEVPVDEFGGEQMVPGIDGVLDRALEGAALGVPRGRPLMELRDAPRSDPSELVAEPIAEQVVIAIPAAGGVEWDDEQPAPLHPVQGRRPIGDAGDRVAERAGHLVEHRGSEQEIPIRFRDPSKRFSHQVVGDVPVITRKPGDESAGIVRTLERESGEMNSSRPAFGPAAQQFDASFVEFHGEAALEDLCRFRCREGEVVRTELREMACCPHAPERQSGIGSGGDGELHPGGKVIDEVADRAMNVLVGDHVIVVEHQEHGFADFGQLVEQGWHDVAHRVDVGVPEGVRAPRGEFRTGAAKCGDDVRPEDRCGVVPVFQPQVRRRASIALAVEPLGEQRRLAPTGGGSDQEDLRIGAGQAFDDLRPRHRSGRQHRRHDLHRQQRCRRPFSVEFFTSHSTATLPVLGDPLRRVATPLQTTKPPHRLVARSSRFVGFWGTG